MKETYNILNSTYSSIKSLTPYLWRNKRAGDICHIVKINDLVYVSRLDKMGKIVKLAESQLKILFRDNKGNLVVDWCPKKFLRLI